MAIRVEVDPWPILLYNFVFDALGSITLVLNAFFRPLSVTIVTLTMLVVFACMDQEALLETR